MSGRQAVCRVPCAVYRVPSTVCREQESTICSPMGSMVSHCEQKPSSCSPTGPTTGHREQKHSICSPTDPTKGHREQKHSICSPTGPTTATVSRNPRLAHQRHQPSTIIKGDSTRCPVTPSPMQTKLDRRFISGLSHGRQHTDYQRYAMISYTQLRIGNVRNRLDTRQIAATTKISGRAGRGHHEDSR